MVLSHQGRGSAGWWSQVLFTHRRHAVGVLSWFFFWSGNPHKPWRYLPDMCHFVFWSSSHSSTLPRWSYHISIMDVILRGPLLDLSIERLHRAKSVELSLDKSICSQSSSFVICLINQSLNAYWHAASSQFTHQNIVVILWWQCMIYATSKLTISLVWHVRILSSWVCRLYSSQICKKIYLFISQTQWKREGEMETERQNQDLLTSVAFVFIFLSSWFSA